MRILKTVSIAMALIACVFSSSAFAQSKIVTNFIQFNSMNDYVPFDGPAPVNLDYATFMEKLNAEVAKGETKIISNSSTVSLAGREATAGSADRLVIGDGRNRYQTPYAANFLTVLPNLVGGETDAASDVVSARVSFESATATELKTRQSLPQIDLCTLKTVISTRLDKISIVGGGHENADGTFTYLAMRFTRAD